MGSPSAWQSFPSDHHHFVEKPKQNGAREGPFCYCFAYAFLLFFLTSGKSASGIFLLLLCFSAVKNLSDVCS